MKRLAIITVGKTHSGKTTFAKELETRLPDSVVIDQDNHAEILYTYYPVLVPERGPNKIKYALTQTIVDYTVNETDCHVILCNSNRNWNGRQKLLDYYQNKEFTSILVYFDVPDNLLEERIKTSQRPTTVLRTALSFKEVLTGQQKEDRIEHGSRPAEGEADHLFVIRNTDDIEPVILKIIEVSRDSSQS